VGEEFNKKYTVSGNCTQKWKKNLKWSLKKQSEDAVGLTSFIRRTTVFCWAAMDLASQLMSKL
jgi:hypothetical protein